MKSLIKFCFNIIAALLVSTFFLTNPAVSFADVVTQPSQRQAGPGGRDYSWHGIRITTQNDAGSQGGAYKYSILRPVGYMGIGTAPESVPVIYFNPALGNAYPLMYGGWLIHLVRQGNIVIFVDYLNQDWLNLEGLTENAAMSIQDALEHLSVLENDNNHQIPSADFTRTATVGHALGAIIAANLTAIAGQFDIPQPKALMSVQPVKIREYWWEFWGIPLENLNQIPAQTLMLVLTADSDEVAPEADAYKIFNEAVSVPSINKDLLTLQSDDHGIPTLVADHFAPWSIKLIFDYTWLDTVLNQNTRQQNRARGIQLSQRTNGNFIFNPYQYGPHETTIDTLDYRGYWKLFDSLMDAAFYNQNRNFALGGTRQQLFMGNWSNSTPVAPILHTQN